MKIKNETEIQLMKILFKTSGKKPTKNITSQRAYPHGVEAKYYRQLQTYFKPLTDYVKKYINENMESLLRGDAAANIKLDAIPGESYRNMIYNLENWLSIYMPDISETPESANNNVIFAGLGKTADETMAFSEKEFKKIIDKGIHVNVPTSAPWWDDMKASWAEDNYTLITSNARKYVEQINILTEQAIVNGMSPGKLKDEIFKATESLSDKHCKLLARDQMGKLNGQITQAQMQEIGLDLYVWSTSYDDRVRDSHALMEGLLCRWDDASVCSYDNGKTWEPRPAGAVDLHPGQDIQCRCIGLAFYPELEAEVEGITLGEATEGLAPVQDVDKLSLEDIDAMTYNQVEGLYEKLSNQYEQLLTDFRATDDEVLKEKLKQEGQRIAELRRQAETRKNVLVAINKIPMDYDSVIEKINSFDNLYDKYKSMTDDLLNARLVGKSEKEINELKDYYFKALNIKDIKPTNEWFLDKDGLFQFGELNVYNKKGIGDLVEIASSRSQNPLIFQPKIYQNSLGEYYKNELKYSKISEKEAIKHIPKGYTLNGISNAENRALINYSHFTPYNKFLREGGDVMSKKETALIKKAIDRTNSESGIFYRGVRGDFAEQLKKLNVGETFVEKSFMSTSSDADVAKKFAGDEGVIMKIKSKGGPGKSIFISSSEFGGESETLFNVNSKLKLVKKQGSVFEFELI